MKIDLAIIPTDWFLWSLQHEHIGNRFLDDPYKPTGDWVVQLQHVQGGRLKAACGDSPSSALSKAIELVLAAE